MIKQQLEDRLAKLAAKRQRIEERAADELRQVDEQIVALEALTGKNWDKRLDAVLERVQQAGLTVRVDE